jgi:hypothetical protein
MNNFNKLYHGSMRDVNELLESGVEFEPRELGALLCNITRRLATVEERTTAPAKARVMYRVTVRKLIAFGRVHELDERVEGEYPLCAISEDDALDQFHNTVPIKVLDDFEITAELVQ